ncbi:MAG TPA: hypothetical protein VKV17_15390 [Bryobacteraceae bacterium]|nr:hypothetical protein [Bryobacteraceae bacterium]
MSKTVLLGLCLSLALSAQQAYVTQTKTQRLEFPAGGLLRVNHTTGDLTIEGSDQPDIEINVTKATKNEFAPQDQPDGMAELDRVRLMPERKGNELTLTETYPVHGHFLMFPGNTRFYLQTHISVPRNARLEIQGAGDLYIYNVTGAIDANLSLGTILLRMPEQGRYQIDAKSKFGGVTSDFAGTEHRTRWQVGHDFTTPGTAGQKLRLRAGYGDIIILKSRRPEYPAPARPTS